MRLSLPKSLVFDLFLLSLLLAIFLGISLGDRPYSAPSESRYIEIGREMAESHDFVTPRLNYVKYFEKPPLFYWVQAEATKLWGIDTFKARIPTALFAGLLCLITYGLGRMLYGRLAGWFASLVLATTLYLFALSRVVLVDVPVSVFIAATLTAFLYVVNAPQGRKRTFILYSMYAAAACAVLTKGLIGAVLPGIIVVLWLALTGRWNLLGKIRLCSGIILFLLISVPWHVLVAQRNPEFLHFYFIHEHFERYLTKEHGRYQPVWFFAVVLIAGLFPWIAFALQSLKNALGNFWGARHNDGTPLFLVLWIAFIFIFFSLSDSKLIPYILPVFPPIAAVIGRYLANAWQEKPTPAFGLGVWLIIAMLCAIAIIPSVLLAFLDADNKVAVALQQAGDEAYQLTLACVISAGILLVVFIQGRKQHLIATLFVVAALIAFIGDQVASHYNKDSMSKIAASIESLDKPGDEVVSYGTYYQDLPVYLKRRITIADWKGELEFGSAHEDTSAWMIDDKEFWKRWLKGDHRMFVVMRDETYMRVINTTPMDLKKSLRSNIQSKGIALHLYGVVQDGRSILFMNQDPMAPNK